MPTTQQRLSAVSEDFVTIQSGEVLNVQAGLIFKSGLPAVPWFVELDTPCPFLHILAKNQDGTFDVWNPTDEAQAFGFVAHHLHSAEQEPVPTVIPVVQASIIPAPTLCPLPGDGESAPPYLLGSFFLEATELIEAARTTPANIIHTDEAPASLAAAVAGSSPGDIIEVRTNATYDPISTPANAYLVVRAGDGFSPVLSGAEALKIGTVTRSFFLSGFTFRNCSTPSANDRGAAISFAGANAQAFGIYIDRCTFEEVQNGSAVVLSYNWGGSYADPPQWAEFSERIAFNDCSFFHCCKNATEGAAILLRGWSECFFNQCTLDGNNNQTGSRGIMLQNCTQFLIMESESFNHQGNGEAFKFDTIGTPTPPEVTVRPSGHIVRCLAHDSIEGIDIDDEAQVTAIDNRCYNNQDEGISVDSSAFAALYNNVCYNNNDGILVEAGGIADLKNNHCYNNTNANFNTAYTIPFSNSDAEVASAIPPAQKRMGLIPAYLVEPPPLGEMFIEDNATPTTFPQAGTFVPLVQGFQPGFLNRLAFDQAQAILHCEKPGWYDVQYHISNIAEQAGVDIEFVVALALTQQGNTRARRRHANIDTGSISGGGIVWVDRPIIPIRLLVANLTNTTTITVIHANVTARLIQG